MREEEVMLIEVGIEKVLEGRLFEDMEFIWGQKGVMNEKEIQ